MKHLIVIVAVTLLASFSLAFARITETVVQIEQRFGKPSASYDKYEKPKDLTKGETTAFYHKNGITIMVTFQDGICENERYSKENGSDFTGDEIVQLLSANAGDSSWSYSQEASEKIRRIAKDPKAGMWIRQDGFAIASHDHLALLGKSHLSVRVTDEWRKAFKAAKKLKDF